MKYQPVKLISEIVFTTYILLGSLISKSILITEDISVNKVKLPNN